MSTAVVVISKGRHHSTKTVNFTDSDVKGLSDSQIRTMIVNKVEESVKDGSKVQVLRVRKGPQWRV